MPIDFEPFFRKYEELVAAADKVFEQVREQYPDCVKCDVGCSDCCHALFDLTLIEAIYINHHFNRHFEGRDNEKTVLIEDANTIDRQLYKLKRSAYQDFQNGKSEDQILKEMGEKRMRCPLLDAGDKCLLYENRPITCRFYGIPTAIGGKGHTCGKSGFEQGEPYPTVNLDLIHKRLYDISAELVSALKSKHSKMAEILVPLSSALLTLYDNEYLGIGDDAKKEGDGNE